MIGSLTLVRKIAGAIALGLLVSGVAFAQEPARPMQIDPFDPGAAGANPGPGCQVGTSGCFPSAPPGPQTPANDPGADTTNPPQLVDPQTVPFYGSLPGPAGRLEEPQATPQLQQQLREEEVRAHEQRTEELLEQQTEELAAQREQLQNQTDQIEQQREQIETLQDQVQAEKEQQKKSPQQPAPQQPAPQSGQPSRERLPAAPPAAP